MDFPVSAEFVATANACQLHTAARGESPEWPASFVELEDGSWVYRVDDTDEYVEDDEAGNPVERSRPRGDVVIDVAAVQAAIDAHDPADAPHVPMDETGRILTLLALYEGSALPSAAEIVKMRDGLTVEDCAAEFYAWLEAADGGL